MQILFKYFSETAKKPERGHGIDVGLDVYTPTEGVLIPGPNKIPLGFGISVPVGYCAAIYPRTSMASGEKTLGFRAHNRLPVIDKDCMTVKDFFNRGVALLAQMPPIDPGYAGEVNLILLNHSNLFIKYPIHTRFGQLVFHPISYAELVTSVDTSRGTGGFGSTGI